MDIIVAEVWAVSASYCTALYFADCQTNSLAVCRKHCSECFEFHYNSFASIKTCYLIGGLLVTLSSCARTIIMTTEEVVIDSVYMFDNNTTDPTCNSDVLYWKRSVHYLQCHFWIEERGFVVRNNVLCEAVKGCLSTRGSLVSELQEPNARYAALRKKHCIKVEASSNL